MGEFALIYVHRGPKQDGRERSMRAGPHLVGTEGGTQTPKGHASPILIEVDRSSILAAARQGAPEAIERLCREGWKPVYRSLARYTDSAAEAEAMTQEVFVRALR